LFEGEPEGGGFLILTPISGSLSGELETIDMGESGLQGDQNAGDPGLVAVPKLYRGGEGGVAVE
jgi:hypothetical protein